ncbi:cobalt-precorrin-5B (C(1))-methyltransferase [Solidesulfovibrio magneticus]|uniref:Cobalt-precorrin-5B C(1)-methyltransferase n=1 Tax=Solidesulfovibrio magneticus (strain ATCC 700980 / DSM 13731 / RS-1) TaxID=573370 RepID=C4XLT7_SOLM1|nr:cobalt-precorrin-5B (C(1))-methyltransferase [Solidesulfovibrio magneticus]BAH74675.1 putative cobalt-precorrin-6A synthase [deacetylating] [Solidesulfovibrio magneticus RS-1]
MKREGKLREGFTTGTAAAGAAKAAALLLLGGEVPEAVDVPLPGGGQLVVPVAEARRDGEGAYGAVIKDGGDDPDATHGAAIGCHVSFGGEDGEIVVDGGEGVGRVTLPGLPVAVGQAAINPAPRAQIAAAVAEVAREYRFDGGLRAIVTVESGEKIAQKTLNPRLGIVGGISILGVSGIVRPFSHDAWRVSISEALGVARALGHPAVGFSTGRRSEALLAAAEPELPATALVQAADFFAHALQEAAKRRFGRIVWAAFGGKLVKMAQGMENTHAWRGDTDFSALAGWCAQAGWPEDAARQAGRSNTARQALEEAPSPGAKAALVAVLSREALRHMRRFAGPEPGLALRVFDFDGTELDCLEDAGTPASLGGD